MALSKLLALLAVSASAATALTPFQPREAIINHEPRHFDIKARDIVASPRLGLAVDTTGSMGEYITALRTEVKKILAARVGTADQPSALVLVPFNDGEAGVGPVSSSNSQVDFGAALDVLKAEGGGDCPELSLTGIGKALEQLPEGGHLFVVTDASAKDASLVGQVISLARGKRIKVFFFLFDNICGTGEPTYTSIAHATGGQTHTGLTVADASLVPALIAAVVRSLSTEIVHVLPDATSPVTDLIPPPVVPLPARRAVSGLVQVAPPSRRAVAALKKRYLSEVRFTVDPSLTSVTFSVDSGRSVTVTRPDGSVVGAGDANANIVVLTRGVVVVVNAPQSGTWSVSVSDCDECSVNVFGQSPVQFTFSLTQSTESGFVDVTEAPVIGCTYRTVAQIDGTITNPTFELRRANGDFLQALPATQGTGALSDSYIGELTVPSGGFTVYLRGTSGSGAQILRVVAGIIRGVSGGTCPGAGTPSPSVTVSDTPTTEPSVTEPPVSATETEEEPTETEPPATTIASDPPITSVRTTASDDEDVTMPPVSGTRPTAVTDMPPGATLEPTEVEPTEVEGPMETGGGGEVFPGIRRPIISIQGDNTVIVCPGPHPVCGGITGPTYYPGGQDTVTTAIVQWTTVCPTVATVTSGTCTSLQTGMATITRTLTVQSVIPCGSCTGHNYPQRPAVVEPAVSHCDGGPDCNHPPVPPVAPCGGAPDCPLSPPPCTGPQCPPPNCPGPDCHGPEGPVCPGPDCHGPEGPVCPGPDCHGPEGPVCPGPMCPHGPEGPVCPGPMCPHGPEEPVCPGPMCPHQPPNGPVCPGPMCPHQPPPPMATGAEPPRATNPGTPPVRTPPVVTGGAAALERVMLAQVYLAVFGVLLW